MSEPRTPQELEGEQEVDLASAWQRVKDRWWLPVGGLLVGAVVGIALSLSGTSTWNASTIVYLGQPFAPLGGGQIQSLATNPRTVNEIIHSESALERASKVSGIPVHKLRSSISTKALTDVGQVRGINPLIEIAVQGSGKKKVELAADSLARRVVERVSTYVTDKVTLLEQQVSDNQAQLAILTKRIADAQDQQAAIVNDKALPLDQRLLLSSNLNATISTADARRAAIADNLFQARQLLNLASSVEESHVVEPAGASKSSARSSRTSLLIGAAVGLIVGVVLALLVEPFTARRRRKSATPA
jgi:hypothetical protein